MRKSKKFITMPVISLEDSQQVGFIKELVVNPVKMEIAGLVVEQKGWFKDQKIVPYSKVRSIGGDAITIEKSSNVEKPANLPEIINLMKDKTLIIGAKVVTENGVFLGYVDEFLVDVTSGKIMSLEITGNLINSVIKGNTHLDMKYIKTVGKEILIADTLAVQQLKKSEGGLQETINGIKETSSNIFGRTLQKTKILGKNLKEYTKRSGLLSRKNEAPPNREAPVNNDILEQPMSSSTLTAEEIEIKEPELNEITEETVKDGDCSTEKLDDNEENNSKK